MLALYLVVFWGIPPNGVALRLRFALPVNRRIEMEATMKEINLRELYPDTDNTDTLVEVNYEVWEVI